MARNRFMAISALAAILLSGPSFAQKIGSESIQNDPVPQEPVATTVVPLPTIVAPGLVNNLPGSTASPTSAMQTRESMVTGSPMDANTTFTTQAGQLLHSSSALAALAQDKSSTPAIQDLAGMIAKQDDSLLAGMAALSSKVPASDPAFAAQLQRLERVPSGDLFDDQYTTIQTGLTQQLTTVFQTQAQAGQGPLRDFANQAMPGLQQVAMQSQALKKLPSATAMP